ncbi:hypothetical protein BDR03DRAFT_967129 [Suillus americanus]|nr:hypothetical protein BDR03DRAFT_967129 [Suillus americanus]
MTTRMDQTTARKMMYLYCRCATQGQLSNSGNNGRPDVHHSCTGITETYSAQTYTSFGEDRIFTPLGMTSLTKADSLRDGLATADSC